MGTAKNMEAYAIYQDYSDNTDLFIKNLSNQLDADFIVNSYDENCEPLHQEDKLTTYSKLNKYRLTIEYFDGKEGRPHYELSLPSEYGPTRSIELKFSPNKLLHIMCLEFEGLWSSFIGTLKFDDDVLCGDDRQKEIEEYENIRSEYISFLKKLNIDSIFIFTHAYYKIEDLGDEEMYPILTFPDILKIAKEKDNLTSFNFETILRANKVSEIDKNFLSEPSLNIALIDKLNPQNDN